MPGRYKYPLYPTGPQAEMIEDILRQNASQWNYAVNLRLKLKTALDGGNLEYVVRTILALKKDNHQPARREAIARVASSQGIPDHLASKLYDVHLLVGDLFTEWGPDLLDHDVIVKKLSNLLATHNNHVYAQLMTAINIYAGYQAVRYMNRSFMPGKGASLYRCRTQLTGFSLSRWTKALERGEPRLKKEFVSFSYSTQSELSKIIRERKKGRGHLVSLSPLPRASRLVKFDYGREIADNGEILEITVKKDQDEGYHLILYVQQGNQSAARTGAPRPA